MDRHFHGANGVYYRALRAAQKREKRAGGVLGVGVRGDIPYLYLWDYHRISQSGLVCQYELSGMSNNALVRARSGMEFGGK